VEEVDRGRGGDGRWGLHDFPRNVESTDFRVIQSNTQHFVGPCKCAIALRGIQYNTERESVTTQSLNRPNWYMYISRESPPQQQQNGNWEGQNPFM